MTGPRIWWTGLAVVAVAGCGKGGSSSVADTTRTLNLVRADSTEQPNDRAIPPAPSRPASRTLAAGSTIDAVTERTISSRRDKAGETFTAGVSTDVKDSRGRIVFPAGSTVHLTITELQPADDKTKADGRITVLVSSVTVAGQTYPVVASITSMAHTLQGRGVGATEVEKTAAGAVIGGVAGRVIGGNAKGTIIGAVAGAAAGVVVAAVTANRDVVVANGTPIVITLNGPVTVPAK